MARTIIPTYTAIMRHLNSQDGLFFGESIAAPLKRGSTTKLYHNIIHFKAYFVNMKKDAIACFGTGYAESLLKHD
jgi:hypothetical protein